MNKKVLAAAIAAAVVASPAAFATSTVYGKIHNSVDMVDTEVNNVTTVDNYQVNDRASRLGFKGSEDLGGGLKAIYQMEFGVTTSGGPQQEAGGTLGTRTRNTFVGLSGGFGTFLVGRHDTPAKVAFYAAGNDHLGDSIIDLNNGVLGVFTEVRANNGIAYISPNFSGFTLAAAVVPGEENEVANDNQSNGLADHVSVGLMYKGGGLKASVGYEKLDNQAGGLASFPATASNNDTKMWQAGASYTFGAFTLGAQYEDTENYGWVDGDDYTAWAVSGKAAFGNNAIILVYTDAELDAKAANQDADSDGWGISAEHNFSKRTKVYAAYATNEIDHDDPADDEETDAFSLGMIHNF